MNTKIEFTTTKVVPQIKYIFELLSITSTLIDVKKINNKKYEIELKKEVINFNNDQTNVTYLDEISSLIGQIINPNNYEVKFIK